MPSEVTESIPITKDDEDRLPEPLSLNVHVMDTGDSDACHSWSENQGHSTSGRSKTSSRNSGSPTNSDEGATRHDLAGLDQPNVANRPATPWTSTSLRNHHNTTRGLQEKRGFIPMPPAPEHIPRRPHKLPSGRMVSWTAALEHNAGLLDDESLYRVLLSRNGYHVERKGPKLVRAMAEYVGDADERLAGLCEDFQSFKGLATRLEGGMNDRVEGADAQGMSSHVNPLKEVLLETRFYPREDGFGVLNGLGQETESRQHAARDSYTSARGPNYLLRVLFEWNELATPSRPTLVPGNIPDSRDINLLSFMVSSRPLAAFFKQRLGFKMDKTPILKLAKPFRAVISNYSRLKSQLAILMSTYGSGNTGNIDSDRRGHPSNCQYSSQKNVPGEAPSFEGEQELESFDQQPALEHFRLLLQFIDRYLGEKLALFGAHQAGRAETIAYEDLWMVFRNGEKIVCPLRDTRLRIDMYNGLSQLNTDGDDTEKGDDIHHVTRKRYLPQAYRVMAAFGGTLKVSSSEAKIVRAPGDKPIDNLFSQFPPDGRSASRELSDQPALQRTTDKLSSLYVKCLYVDFNGAKYGTLDTTFVFKPFDGEMHIKSLEAFPLKYYASLSSSNLMQRGRKFIDATASPRHMDHAGMTIGENKEEVRVETLFFVQLMDNR